MNTWILSLLVNNHFGVLTRVTGLFSRRGYNIVSLSVGETHRPEFSRITIQTEADNAGVNQIIKQLQKLEDVKAVRPLPKSEAVVRELLIVKLVVPEVRRQRLKEGLEEYDYRVPYADEGRMILEFTGDSGQCAGFLEVVSDYTVLELCRTGVTAMSAVQTEEI